MKARVSFYQIGDDGVQASAYLMLPPLDLIIIIRSERSDTKGTDKVYLLGLTLLLFPKAEL